LINDDEYSDASDNRTGEQLKITNGPGKVSSFGPGSFIASIFSLIVATLGAGTMTLPSVPVFVGIFPGAFFIILGASLSIYSGMLLVSCAVKT
jgi:amino acid permease